MKYIIVSLLVIVSIIIVIGFVSCSVMVFIWFSENSDC